MPLLRKQPFHKQKPPIDLSPDEEVFHCKITNEIFRDYEAFFERIILCNSLVWSCAITGRSGMTYQEAVECEEKAKRHLATFQDSLQRPLLFLATLTHRSRLVDLNDDVFLFAKDRYFIGETVDVTLPGEAKRAAKILRVVLPGDTKTNGDIIVIDEDSDSEEENKKEPPHPHKMKYVVQFTSSKAPPVTVTANQVNRKKGLYTRDKSKLFLKQHCEPIDGLWKVKEEKLRKSNLKTAKFLDFFAGPPPVFTVSVIKKKQNFKKNADAGKSTPVSATPDRTNASTSATNSPQDSAVPSPQSSSLLTPKERAAQKEQAKQDKLAEKMAKKEEIRRRIEEEKLKKKEEREKEREKKREERRKQIEKLKEWSRPREDMECDDLKPLPEFSEVKTRLPAAVFGDALMVLEYITAFKSVFDFKQFFPKGFTWAQLEAALVNPDPQGPLCDLIQMLLCALFNLQEEEAEEYQELEREELDQMPVSANTGEEEQAEEDDNNMSNNELLRSATIMAQVSQQTFGMPLRDTLLDQFTLTEVMRLHLMSSGARANSKNARFRYQQRGGYTSLDDPGLELRKQHPGLLRKLNNNNIFDLQPDDKVRLVMTLVQQVMSYAAVRDIVEESFDKLRVKKYDLKLLQWAEVRREREDAAAKYRRLMEERLKERERRLQQAAKAAEERCGTSDQPSLEQPIPVVLDDDSFETPEERQKREDKEKAEEAKKKADYAKRELDMLQQIQELQRTNALYPLGRDRLYRRYWLLGAVPAVLVEDHELFLSGMPSSTTVSEETGDMMPTLIRQDDHNTSSDKENEVSGAAAANDSGGSGPVSNSGSAENGDCIVISDEEGEAASKAKAIPTMEMDEPPKLDSHPAHQSGSQRQEPRWYVLDSKTCLDQLMDSLNPRGFRESVLHTAIQEMRPLLNLTIDTCPLDALRAPPEGEEKEQPPKPHVHTRSTAPRIVEGTTQTDSASEAIELTLRDALLDLDDRIFVGSLGALKVKDRAAWRAALESGGYSPQTDELPFAQLENKENSEGNTSVSEEVVAKHMAYALAQIARGVEPRFLRSPLGEETEDKKKVHKEEKQDDGKEFGRRRIFERWEESVLAATSLSQVFLHLAAFDKSVKWDRSALMARCRICRRKGDAEKMLLCDGCDRGHHMYCLKPPKTKVPSGDWFCSNCQPKQPQPSPRKNRRRTFSEVSDDEEAEESLKLQETIEEASEEEEEEAEESEDEPMEEEEDEEENEDVCAECRQDGKLILCDVCPRSYHLHCARPPLKKVPRGKWMCQVCVGGNRAGKIQIGKPKANSSIKEKKESKTTPSSKSGKSSSSRPGSRRETPRNSPTPTSTRGKKQERSANREVTPKVKGHSSKDVTPKSRGHSDRDSTPKSWDSEKDGLGKLKRSSSSASRLSQDSSDFETSARHYTSSTRGNTTVQQMKLCEDLLQELIRHQDAWPFLKPVDKKLVPDYYDVIESPMDLSTIRNKVHKFEYDAPIQLLDDVRLIFNNCIEYNARNTPEYRAGQTLGRFFHGRLRDLGIQDETSTPPPPAKKQRR